MRSNTLHTLLMAIVMAVFVLPICMPQDARAQASDALPPQYKVLVVNLEWGGLFTGGEADDSTTVVSIPAPAYIERAWLVADTTCAGIDSLQVRLREQQLAIISYNPTDFPTDGTILQEWVGWEVESDDTVTLQLYNASTITGQVRLFLKIRDLY